MRGQDVSSFPLADPVFEPLVCDGSSVASGSRARAYRLAAQWFDRMPTRREVTEFQLLDYPSPDDVVRPLEHEYFGSDDHGALLADVEALGCIVDCDPYTDPIAAESNPYWENWD